MTAAPQAREFTSQFVIPAGHPCLAGHFPGQPIVPAVLLLDEVLAALQRHTGLRAITGITNAKFLAPVKPEEVVRVQCTIPADSRSARFTCERISASGAQLAVQGDLVFGAP